MKLRLSQRFECRAAELWDVFYDPEFERRLKEVSGVDRELLEQREEGGLTIVRRRVVSERKLPTVMAKAFKTSLEGRQRFLQLPD